MVRLLGFLSGTALVVSAMVAVLGTPAMQTGAPRVAADATRPPIDTAGPGVQGPASPDAENDAPATPAADPTGAESPETLTDIGSLNEALASGYPTESAGPADAPATTEVMGPVYPADSAQPDSLQTPLTADRDGPAGIETAASPALLPGNPPRAIATDAAVDTPGPVATDMSTSAEISPADANARWHPFWQPFRSQIAANGFAARLQAVTGMNYRVVRRMPGAYEVAFAYDDASELTAKLARIESATGLDLPDAAP